MSSRHRDKVTTNDRMETSKLTTPDKHAEPTQNASPRSDMSAPRTDTTGSGVVTCQREKRRREHNDTEKKRKEQIKACICRMGELLPPNYLTGERQSTLETVEKSLGYMREMKDAKTKFEVMEESLQQEINTLMAERDKLLEIIKSAGLSSDTIPTNGVSSTTDTKDENPKPKSKTKRRTTLNNQIQFLHEQREKEKQSEQEMISSSVSLCDDSGNTLGQMVNMPGAPFLNGQNMMFNPMMMQNGNQLMMQGMMGPNGNQIMGTMGLINPNGGSAQGMQQQNGAMLNGPGFNSLIDLNKQTGEDSDAGLLQLAMQDAGITPNSSTSQPGSSAVTPSIATEANQEAISPNAQSNPLQTLASVATSQELIPENCVTTENQTENQSVASALAGPMSATSAGSTGPVMAASVGQNNYQNILQNSNNNNNLINMPVVGNQSVLAGQQQQSAPQPQTQQIMFVNEQGIPMIANVPIGMDPNSHNSFNNLQKQGLLPSVNQQQLIKDQSTGLEQNQMNNAFALAQQQANMAALLGQSANLHNMAFQQQNMLGGNIIQTPNGQFIQQINPQAQMQQLQGQGQLVGVQGQGQGIVVGGPQGNQSNNFMTQFSVPNQQSQLPSALILPNGQIIPVVTNPNTVNPNAGQNFGQAQGSQTRMAGPQLQGTLQQGGDGGQFIPGSGSQGLLMTAASGPQVVSAGASLNTSVVPTSAIQSVMTTQIQGSSHVQTQKTASTSGSGALTDVSQSSNQPKVVGLPPNIMNQNQQIGGAGVIQSSGAKSGATPILISLPINGQPTTVLLDPVTMQVLGTVAPQQGPATSGPASGSSGTMGLANHSPATSQASTLPPSTASKGKSGKNNANQRAICPKPLLENEGSKSKSSSKKKKAKSGQKNKDTVQPDSLAETLQIQIPESTTDPETTSAISSESTDILAKAAESIFSSPLGEITTVGGFYNPANEDNPLHIDTSAAEPDDENKSPDKNDGKFKKVDNSCPSSIKSSVIGINPVSEVKSVSVSGNTSKMSTSVSASVVNDNEVCNNSENVPSLSATLEELAGIKFGDSGDIPMDIQQDKHNDLMEICMETPQKPNKKVKVATDNKTVEKKDASSKQTKTVNKANNPVNKTGSHKKQPIDRLPVIDKSDNDSQMDIESTLIHIPEAITFSENDISDVLDQVEKLGNSPPLDSPKPSATSKKSKAKRSKVVADSEGEPCSKKRKSAKDVKEIKHLDLLKDIPLSMPSNLSSVYDFDDSVDIVPSILPLNGKDYTSLTSKPGSVEITNKQPSQGSTTQNKNKSQKSNRLGKMTKEVEPAPRPVITDANSAALFAFPETNDKKKEKDKPKERHEIPKQTQSQSMVTESLPSMPSMPDISTNTSLFGYVVPKKLQRHESSKQTSQVSPKPPLSVHTSVPQSTVTATKTSMVSPKQAMVSPKTSLVSPHDSTMSPEQSMVSPKLTIVSPSLLPENDMVSQKSFADLPPQNQNVLPVNDSISPKGFTEMMPNKYTDMSPNKYKDMSLNKYTEMPPNKYTEVTPNKYTEMTPVKKRTIMEKNDDLKVSSFSALNADIGVSLPFGGKENTFSSTLTAPSMGVITSVKSSMPSSIDKVNDSVNRSMADNQNVPFKPVNSENNQVNLQSKMSSSNVNQKPINNTRNFTPQGGIMGDKNFTSGNIQPPPPSSYKNVPAPQRAPVSSVSPQNNQFGNASQFMHDSVFNSQSSNTNKQPMGKENNIKGSVMASVNSYPTPYTAESLFTNTQDKVIKSPPNVNISTNPSILNQQKADHVSMSKNRNNAYSVDSFVQSSRDNNTQALQMRNDGLNSQSDIGMPSNNLTNQSNDFSRLQNESSPDNFSIATIGLNLPPITSTTPSSSFMDLNLPNSSTVISSNTSSSSFSFSLSSSSATTTTSSGGLAHHQFPFYPTLSSSAAGPNDNVMPSMSNMGMFPPHGNSNSNNVIQRNNTVMHPSGSSSNIQRGDSSHISRVESSNISRVDNHAMSRIDTSQSMLSKDVVRDQTNSNKPSCSKQSNKMPKPPNQPSMQEPFNFPNQSTNETNFFHDGHMKSNVGKSPTEQMRKPQESMNTSRSVNQGSHPDKRGGPIDRSPQMMNSGQTFYSPSYPPSKSLNTPPLHHPSLMPPDDRIRNMSNRSPYENHYPSSSQPYSSMAHSYPNRFDSGNVSYSRDNPVTQPLSHSSINSGGRKSANPQQASVVKPPPKQSAPPLVPMAPQQLTQATPQGPRPTPPQSHRSTTPLSNAPQPTPTPQANQSRQSKAQSRTSKQQKKSAGTKPLPFVEVDSNLSNSIFENNRSITPFFPMQNLSPQSRMQHEGSPFLHGNFFPGARFPNSNTPMPKNSDIGPHFNPHLFAPRGPQNGLGLNFQPGFGMNPLHGNHGNGPQITPHSAPHMANFSLNNIFPDSGSQNESSLNISPIKFPHTNFQPQGMDPNAMQQHHPYNRGHPSVMSINSILGPNHHGFDGRMNTSMSGPFHSHGHPSFIPPLNFSMHDP